MLYGPSARRNAAAIPLLFTTLACAPAWTAPSSPEPSLGYVPVAFPPQSVWDAVVDFLVETGTEWDDMSPELRLVRFKVLAASGPEEGWWDPWFLPNEEAREYADCGEFGSEPGAGLGDLWFDLAIRVRSDQQGGSLLRVMALEVWQENFSKRDVVPCVSTGVFESRAIEGIWRRIDPVTR